MELPWSDILLLADPLQKYRTRNYKCILKNFRQNYGMDLGLSYRAKLNYALVMKRSCIKNFSPNKKLKW